MRKFFLLGLSILLGLQLLATDELQTLPSRLLGNWINKDNNEWEYGFYEQFAIARTGFWNYKSIREGRKQISIVLENGREEIHLKVRRTDGEMAVISADGHASTEYRIWNKTFLPYPTKDSTRLPVPCFQFDTVTILGYLRHAELYGKKQFEVGFGMLVRRGQEQLTTDIDSLGRFYIRIPVCAPQLVFLDWSRLLRRIVVLPGEKIMLYADVRDLLPTEEDRMNKKRRFQRDRDILFMGQNARLHNEFTHCPYPFFRSMYKLRETVRSDMEYLHLTCSDYEVYQDELNATLQKYPTLSERCLETVRTGVKCEMAAKLMQNKFNFAKRGRTCFDDPAYMDFVTGNFSRDSVAYFFSTRDYATFVTDYTTYIQDLSAVLLKNGGRYRVLEDMTPYALRMLYEKGKLPQLTAGEIEKYISFIQAANRLDSSQDSLTLQRLSPEWTILNEKVKPILEDRELRELTLALRQRKDLLLYDTLIADTRMREIMTLRYFVDNLEHERIVLNPYQWELAKEKITTPLLREQLQKQNAIYEVIKNRKITYPESLKNAEDFAGISNADTLVEKLLSPYRGKIIVLDIWGSWCEPCKRMMAHVHSIKKQFENQEVIFMYFAYGSPREAWENVIREFDLSGPQVVHYNLPLEQQKLIIQKWNIQGYPTYMLINHNGKVVNANMTFPINQQKFTSEIREALKK